MYWRCNARNSSSTGSTVTTEPAIISSLSCTCSRDRPASATGSVCRSLVGQHDQRPHEVVPGAEEAEDRERRRGSACSSGTTIERKMRNSLAPSMRAASSSSSGMRQRVLAHEEDAEDARHAPARSRRRSVLTRPSCLSIRNSGSIATCARNHQRAEQEAEEALAAAEAQLGERVAGHDVEASARSAVAATASSSAVEQIAAHADAARTASR